MTSGDEPGGPNPPPLDAEQRETLLQANERLRKRILGAGKVAAFNGWTLVVFGALSLLTGAFSATGLVVGVVLLGFGWNELRGRRLLRRLDRNGPHVLGWNQIGLAVAAFVYCAWSSWRAWAHPEPMLAELETTLGISSSEIARMTVLAYAVVFVVSAVALALTARYHFTRRERLEAYLRETPEWVVEIQRSTL